MSEYSEEQLEQTIFTIITMAGDAKASFYEALDCAKSGDYEQADAKVKEGDGIMSKAHNAQTNLISNETNGQSVPIGLLMVHAQDHLMNAILVREMLNVFIGMQKEINELKKVRDN